MRVASNTNLRNRGRLERQLHASGLGFAGVDEVGRGCLAGPVYAACVALDWSKLKKLPSTSRDLIRDSKLLSSAQRERMVPVIEGLSLIYQVESASVEEINQLGIAPASFLAMRRAIQACGEFDVLLVDGKVPLPDYKGRQETIVKGDYLSFSIAAASILAKQERDKFMWQQSKIYPDYGFDNHVGYGTRQHIDSIAKYGICPLHRSRFAPIRNYLETCKVQYG